MPLDDPELTLNGHHVLCELHNVMSFGAHHKNLNEDILSYYPYYQRKKCSPGNRFF